MPSLNALKEFKASFSNIANERKDVTAKNIPFDDLPLPEKDAPPFDPSRYNDDTKPASGGSAPAPDDTPADAFDFGALLGDVSGDTDSPPDDGLDNLFGGPAPDPTASLADEDTSGLDDFLKDIAADTVNNEADADAGSSSDAANSFGSDSVDTGDPSFLADLLGDTAQTAESDAPPPADDGSFPADLLSGFSDEMSSTPADEVPDFNFDDHPMDFQSEDTSADDDDDDEEGIDMGGETRTGEFNVDRVDTSADDEVSDADAGVDFSSADTSSDENPPDENPTDDFPMDDFSTDNIPADGLPSGDFSLDDLGDSGIDLGGEAPDTPADGSASAEASDDFSMGDDALAGLDFPAGDDSGSGGFDDPLSGMDFPSGGDSGFDGGGDSGFDAGIPSGAEDLGDPLAGIDFPGGGDSASDDSDNPLSGLDFPTGGDSGGLDDLGIDFSSDSLDIDLGSGSHAGDSIDGDEFHIPGLDEIFGDKTDTIISVPEKKGLFGRKKKKNDEVQDINDVEEISLTQDQLGLILKTLASYPLNLRVACEEMIAELVILPQQLSKLINLLVNGAGVKETAAHVELVTGKPIVIPKSFQKGTGAAFEAEQSSFAYIFVHNFLPILRLFAFIAAMVFSVIYLGYRFVYIPLRAESLYQRGYERIAAGEYQRANDLFQQAFALHRNKKWFYKYAEGFRDQRRFMLAEGKYDELLRYYPRDKKGVLDYASLQTYYMFNYDKADRLLQRELLDFAPDDFEGLLASGDNFLVWGDSDPERFFSKYEDARYAYARLLELNGWQAPIVERMLKYFIRVDNLYEVLVLRNWFEALESRKLRPESLAELGGYLLDKQLERPKGVPNPYVESIESVRAMLLQAVKDDPNLPEPHYHLARYHKNLGNVHEERITLEYAIKAFDFAKSETVKRRLIRVDTHSRYAELLKNNREFFPSESQLIRGIELYNDYLSRNLIRATPQLGQLYGAKGDLEFYTKTGDRTAASNAIAEYRRAEENGYAPPEMLYRMGAAHYQLEDWGNALSYLFKASTDMPLNRRTLYALGNAAYQRGDYFAAQGYYNRLLDILENQRVRQPVLLPNDNPQFLELGERLMMARNNAGVVNEALAEQTGNREYRSTAMALYAESARAWDTITRNPETMIRSRLSEIPGAPGINLGYLNAANAMRPVSTYNPGIFVRIDRDGEEPSKWEELAPFGGR